MMLAEVSFRISTYNENSFIKANQTMTKIFELNYHKSVSYVTILILYAYKQFFSYIVKMNIILTKWY